MLQLYGYLELVRGAPSLQDFYRCLDGRDRMVLRLICYSYNQNFVDIGQCSMDDVATYVTTIRSLDTFESESMYAIFGQSDRLKGCR
jgi:hypothetical protein